MSHDQAERRTGGRDSGTGFVWMSAAAVLVMLVALATAWYLWFPAQAEPFTIRLEGGSRDNERTLMAPPDRPLVLHVAGSISLTDAIAYEVSITESSSGTQVFSQAGIRPTGESGLRVEVPQGLGRAGRYDVHVTAQGGAATRPVDERFHFFIAAAP
jgi:hypothetical protein